MSGQVPCRAMSYNWRISSGVAPPAVPWYATVDQTHLRARLPVDAAAQRLARFFTAAVDLMKLLARACGHTHLSQLTVDDLTTWDRDLAYLTGVRYAGVTPL